MYLYTEVALVLVAIASMAKCFAVLDEVSHEHDGNRKGKVLYHEHESERKGKRIQRPRTGPVEDVLDYEGLRAMLKGDGALFFNSTNNVKGRQGGTTQPKTITMQPGSGVVQIKINFNDVVLQGPTENGCQDERLVIEDANNEILILCGYLSNQHVYIDVDENSGPYKIIVHILESTPKGISRTGLSIRTENLKQDNAVPHGCLQYYDNNDGGEFESFNYGGNPPRAALVNQDYSICFGYVSGYCGISFEFTRLDVGELQGYPCAGSNDYLLVDGVKYCGDKGVESGDSPTVGGCSGSDNDYEGCKVVVEANDVIIVKVNMHNDGTNTEEEEGFKATYTRLTSCLNAS